MTSHKQLMQLSGLTVHTGCRLMANMCQPCDSKDSSPSAPQGSDLERLFNLRGALWNFYDERTLEAFCFSNLLVARLPVVNLNILPIYLSL
jgi:hypothetical protein